MHECIYVYAYLFTDLSRSLALSLSPSLSLSICIYIYIETCMCGFSIARDSPKSYSIDRQTSGTEYTRHASTDAASPDISYRCSPLEVQFPASWVPQSLCKLIRTCNLGTSTVWVPGLPGYERMKVQRSLV